MFKVSLTQKEKDYIVDSVVGILKSTDKKNKIEELRDKVLANKTNATPEDEEDMDEVIYSVIKAIDELYG